MQRCSLCGKRFEGQTFSPFPLASGQGEVCCDECNMLYATPARFRMSGALDAMLYTTAHRI